MSAALLSKLKWTPVGLFGIAVIHYLASIHPAYDATTQLASKLKPASWSPSSTAGLELDAWSSRVKGSRPAANTTVRANAAFVMLTRNGDLWDMLRSIRSMEDRFNSRYNYPYVFLNEVPFDDQFIKHTTALCSGKTYYGLVSNDDWKVPDSIDRDRAAQVRYQMQQDGVIYGGSESYRQMCRFESGYFFRQPLLDQFDYYWRIDPNVKFFCDLDYDPFMFMQQHNKTYGFTISLYEYKETIKTLWDTTKDFMKAHPEHIARNNMIDWLQKDDGTYNLCHFWSNFEIGKLDFFRSQAYLDYFNYLDQAGGFYYERWGDAPVHSIAVSLMQEKNQLHFFSDIGYRHEPFQHCPNGRETDPARCDCNPNSSDNFEWHGYSCTALYHKLQGTGKTIDNH
ncbi:glycosyltransferase family 15 protein [Mixia osmundae IAM 14324]|uniref:Glycosyltransferase family 15 protein n=1 Tax=Mixia osmundae (strain CBS 9802 / IAM 14324 / JCM 22182 / KY 12970) TaxID=764103 RepID=G7DX31_MIXOS|nr:glycosyltransferase family 15 protein [Mixia osmundae IAM 14324]KEI38064.1 glycosyltransferase family 15 protein [Mixia osmundae IAM 14324]GAA95128.1 hypothetical protein E5Q_01783 [Mixia osmundae IAM 14324]